MKNLLFPSSQFEPYIPDSQQDVLKVLEILGSLAILTQKEVTLREPQNMTYSSTTANEQSKVQTLSQDTTQNLTDRLLLQKLEELRNSRQFQRRTPGVFTSIIRKDSPRPQ